MLSAPSFTARPLAYALMCISLGAPLLALSDPTQAETDSEPDELPALAATREQASVVGVSSGGLAAWACWPPGLGAVPRDR